MFKDYSNIYFFAALILAIPVCILLVKLYKKKRNNISIRLLINHYVVSFCFVAVSLILIDKYTSANVLIVDEDFNLTFKEYAPWELNRLDNIYCGAYIVNSSQTPLSYWYIDKKKPSFKGEEILIPPHSTTRVKADSDLLPRYIHANWDDSDFFKEYEYAKILTSNEIYKTSIIKPWQSSRYYLIMKPGCPLICF